MNYIRRLIATNRELKKIVLLLLKSANPILMPMHRIRLAYNKRSRRKKCYICGVEFHSFSKYRGGRSNKSEFIALLDIIGSDTDNFGCLYCGSNDRERHLFMFFDRLSLWRKFRRAEILHFAPEKRLANKIMSYSPEKYIQGDLFPQNKNVKKIDITKIKYSANSFDILICNHVLEHVPKYLDALQEIFRVLKPGGMAILQTPFSNHLKMHNFEADTITTSEQKYNYYGQEDHVRVFSGPHFLRDLEEIGFMIKKHKNNLFFTRKQCEYYGVNSSEDLLTVFKPKVKKYEKK